MNVRIFFVVVLATVLSRGFAAEPATMEDEVQAIFAQLKTIKSMRPRMEYTLPAHGKDLTGSNDDFLRQRTAAEISESKLSCGCGDYAAVFLDQITARGYETLLVEGVQLSSQSLVSGFSGHAIVAIRPHDQPAAPWWLVDSTNRIILSRDWSLQSKRFETAGFVYWIGYCGSFENYPIHNGAELKQFYGKMLDSVPIEVFDQTLYQFKFTVDPSMSDGKGGYLNPRLPNLWRKQEEIFAQRGIKPARTIPITLMRGADDGMSDFAYEKSTGWVGHVGLKSACSASLLAYIERKVRSNDSVATN